MARNRLERKKCILEELKYSGGLIMTQIMRKVRLEINDFRRLVQELIEEDLVNVENKKYSLTDNAYIKMQNKKDYWCEI